MSTSTFETARRDRKIEYFTFGASVAFVIASALFFFAPESWWPDFYSPKFYSVTSLMSAFFITLPKAIMKTSDRCRAEAVLFLRLVITIGIVLNGLGELYLYQLYKYGFQYDKLIHLTTSFIFVLVLTVFGEAWFNIPYRRAVIYASIVTFSSGLAWELFEYLSDLFFKTTEFGVYGHYVFSDTIFDILFDILGVGLGFTYFQSETRHEKLVSKYCYYRAEAKI